MAVPHLLIPVGGRVCTQVSQEQFDKIMALIQSGIEEGAKLEVGGKRYGAPASLLGF